ncbi:hypothetical protein IKF20_00790 [Candidatus Saccharibacteria bacterium]|nr:hypothetical protein [Candidatus Saccharibacteria bacterium]
MAKKELKERLMGLWLKNHETYESLIPKYNELLDQIRELNSKRGDRITFFKIKKSDLKDYPTIKLLKIHRERDARAYLDRLDESEMIILANTIQDYLESYIYRTLCNKIAEYEYRLAHPESKRHYATITNCYCRR